MRNVFPRNDTLGLTALGSMDVGSGNVDGTPPLMMSQRTVGKNMEKLWVFGSTSPLEKKPTRP